MSKEWNGIEKSGDLFKLDGNSDIMLLVRDAGVKNRIVRVVFTRSALGIVIPHPNSPNGVRNLKDDEYLGNINNVGEILLRALNNE